MNSATIKPMLEEFFSTCCPQYAYGVDFYRSKRDVMSQMRRDVIDDEECCDTPDDWSTINVNKIPEGIQKVAEKLWDWVNEF